MRAGQRLFFLAIPLEGYDVGLGELEDGIYPVKFSNIPMARSE
jgi:hypothetical protein